MTQNNIFTVISVVLILLGLVFFFMGSKIAADAFPNVDATGQVAVSIMLEVVAALSFGFGILAYATRTVASMAGPWTLGTAILLCVTLKHLFLDGVNVPIPALAIQVLNVLLCGYLLIGKKKVM